jgi:hypothetical protein
MPRILTPEQKETWMNICADILQNIENDPNFLGNVITCGEPWFFPVWPKTKWQSMHWKSPRSQKKQVTFESDDLFFFFFIS